MLFLKEYLDPQDYFRTSEGIEQEEQLSGTYFNYIKEVLWISFTISSTHQNPTITKELHRRQDIQNIYGNDRFQ